MRANKEKLKAEKRERELLKAQREQEVREGIVQEVKTDGVGWGEHVRLAHEADLSSVLASKGPPEPPKDRSVLATMRVIRRNLVYAVGMPPNIATEELLRKPEYFGQYGKIAKIVINRNHNPGDPRRASASAYVTFVHKVSYCFIDLCVKFQAELDLNFASEIANPQQEDTLACILALDGFYYDGRNIRASYGTSKYCSAFIKSVKCNNPDCTYLHHMGDSEDTFTKQEIQAGYVTSGRDVLARQQQIMAQLQNAVGTSGRKKVGGGGPSATGKASANPVFPPPTFDEPLPKSSLKSAQAQQKIRLGGGPTPAVAAAMSSAPISGPSAASIVAGNHNPAPAPPAAHQTLTPLTPLKRTGSAVKPLGLVGSSQDLTPAESLALQKQREEQLAQQQKEMSRRQSEVNGAGKLPSSPSSSSVGSGASKGELKQNGLVAGTQIGAIGAGTIGGASIPMGSSLLGGGYTAASNSLEFGSVGHVTGSGALGGQPIGQIPSEDTKSGVIGGISLAPSNNAFSLESLLSGSSDQPVGGDKWGAVGGNAGQAGLFANSSSFGMSSGGIWGGDESSNSQKRTNPAPIGSNRSNGAGSDIGGTSLFGNNSNPFGSGGGSSALASMLGIELPTGSGSLRESGLLGSQPAVGSLNNANAVGAIGAKTNNMLPIGAPSSQGLTIGSYNSGGGNNSDMALLQSLLPGVNITSGAASQQVGSLNQGSQLGGDKWNGGLSQQHYNNDEQQRSGNIW